MTTLAQVLERIRPSDRSFAERAAARHLTLTKPPGSLGRLEELSIRLAAILGTERPVFRGKAVIVAAGDHGVVAQGVTGYPQEVTAQMAGNFLAGGAAVSAMARTGGVGQLVVDAGIASDRLPDHPQLRSLRVGRGTADISRGPAMTRRPGSPMPRSRGRPGDRSGRMGHRPDRPRRHGYRKHHLLECHNSRYYRSVTRGDHGGRYRAHP